MDADVRAAADVRELTDFSAVVLGAALYMWRIHGDAKKFLARNRQALMGLPVAVFALGPLNDKVEEFTSARETLDKALAKQSWLTPVSVTIFGGRFDPQVLRFPDNNPGMKNMPPSDIRDWDAIRSWAADVAETFSSHEAG
jgi:menaquinone-dependent protoporphyrinogen oxidase